MVDKLSEIPAPPDDAVFSIVKLERVSMPHAYCITSRHVVEASDNFGGRLTERAIETIERKGGHCGMKGCRLPYSQHKSPLTLFIKVPQNKDLNAVPGLHAYLLKVKELGLGIEGFAFPT